jgi:hypothetical protein
LGIRELIASSDANASRMHGGCRGGCSFGRSRPGWSARSSGSAGGRMCAVIARTSVGPNGSQRRGVRSAQRRCTATEFVKAAARSSLIEGAVARRTERAELRPVVLRTSQAQRWDRTIATPFGRQESGARPGQVLLLVRTSTDFRRRGGYCFSRSSGRPLAGLRLARACGGLVLAREQPSAKSGKPLAAGSLWAIQLAHEPACWTRRSSKRGDRGWPSEEGQASGAFPGPHRADRRTNSPTKCEIFNEHV